ncbi:MAG TPA: helix-turn-helix domain-containing protein [Caulobacteraceae bacterium]|jgi:cytoskeletal protein RodZ|nr:helix-turn-helix domain-containing protein [Caulobacteraceae bacterium]
MTPLDTGNNDNGHEAYIAPSWDDDVQPVSLSEAPSLAAGLKAAREATGRTLEDLSDATRVRKQYLIALEEGAYDRLPSRPFSTGYVRAYARALGLDEETAADRFKTECPDASATLRAPVGSELDEVKPRHTGWIVAGVVLISAVVVWNVARRTLNAPKHESSALAQAATPKEQWTLGATPNDGDNAIRLSAPLPPPKDQNVPAPYYTPGIEKELTSLNQTGDQAQGAVTATAVKIPVGAAFNPKGAVFGAASDESLVTLQDRAAIPVSLVLRTADNVILFSRTLGPGEAYRAPRADGLQIDVSDPAAISVFLNGEYHGALQQTVTPLQNLNAQAQALAAKAAAAVQAAAPQANTGG